MYTSGQPSWIFMTCRRGWHCEAKSREGSVYAKLLQTQYEKANTFFIGLIGYYRKFIPSFSAISAPLTDLTKIVRWTKEHYLNKAKCARARLVRWALALQPFKIRITGIKGKDRCGRFKENGLVLEATVVHLLVESYISDSISKIFLVLKTEVLFV